MNKYRGPKDPNFILVAGRIKDIMEKDRTDRLLTREQRDCMQALSFDYRGQKDLNRERVEGTCEWFLNHEKFRGWRRETTANLLWVTADPGCGKSVLSKALIDEGLLNPDNPDARTASTCYFFFKDDAERGRVVNALRSILHQLFRQKPWLIHHAVRDYQDFGREIPFSILWEILLNAAKDPRTGPVICVLDALDECETLNRKSLIKYITDCYYDSQTSKSKLKFIITSRPYYDLHMDFGWNNLPLIHLNGDESSEKIGEEIDIVVSSEVSRISNIHKPPLDQGIQESLIQYIKKQENRTYLWVHLMLEELSRTLESSERQLTRLLKAIPRSVDDAYEKILERANDPKQANRVLSLIVTAISPLSLKELNIALELLAMKEIGEMCTLRDIELDEPEAFRAKIRNHCGLFVNIVDQKIHLIHQTAKEFLTCMNGTPKVFSNTKGHQIIWKHSILLRESNFIFGEICILYLLLIGPDFSELRHLPSDKDGICRYINGYGLLNYSASFWSFHQQQSNGSGERELIKSIMKIVIPDDQSVVKGLNNLSCLMTFLFQRTGVWNTLLMAAGIIELSAPFQGHLDITDRLRNVRHQLGRRYEWTILTKVVQISLKLAEMAGISTPRDRPDAFSIFGLLLISDPIPSRKKHKAVKSWLRSVYKQWNSYGPFLGDRSSIELGGRFRLLDKRLTPL
ncbi:MAG: hypothetical protein M1822_000656 [Bathelium mastoideum]|nr:MAG: hypothetical protein M1822_000656 [Bathelium mastoideum]